MSFKKRGKKMTKEMIIFIVYVMFFGFVGICGILSAKNRGTNWFMIIMALGFICSPIIAKYCL